MMAEKTQDGSKFSIRKIYLKDVSFESPQAPNIFTQPDVNPAIDVQMRITHSELNKEMGFYEVVLSMTVSAKSGDATTFLVEVQQAGVFELVGINSAELPLALEVACPNVLLPFAREAISDFIAKGGFPQLLINPVNFEALYMQKHQQPDRQDPAGGGDGSTKGNSEAAGEQAADESSKA